MKLVPRLDFHHRSAPRSDRGHRGNTSSSRSSATDDTNVDPDEIDHIIPANDDAIRSIPALQRLIADSSRMPSVAVPRAPAEPSRRSSRRRSVVRRDLFPTSSFAALAGGKAALVRALSDDDEAPARRPPENTRSIEVARARRGKPRGDTPPSSPRGAKRNAANTPADPGSCRSAGGPPKPGFSS